MVSKYWAGMCMARSPVRQPCIFSLFCRDSSLREVYAGFFGASPPATPFVARCEKLRNLRNKKILALKNRGKEYLFFWKKYAML
jgi:hypothetical protein